MNNLIYQKLCILIADDDMRMRRGLKDLLHAKGYTTFEAATGNQALNIYYANSDKIDLILLDIMMPEKDGFEVLTELRQSTLVPVIMLTAKDMEGDQLFGLTRGADDYITKPFSSSLLLARIEVVLRRTGKLRAIPLVVGDLQINTEEHLAYINNTPLTLTKQEFKLLLYFATHVNMTLSREQLLNAVWSYHFDGDARTVDTHVKQLRAKLTDKYPYIKTIHGIGYRFEVGI